MVKDDVEIDDWDRHWNDIELTMALNPAHQYRRRLILAGLRLDSASAPRVLDIGSGLGDFLLALSEQFPDIPKLGLELSGRGVAIATRRLPEATFLQRDLIAGHHVPAEFREFGTHAVCSEVLEHVDDPVRLLRNARPYMAKGCRLVITVPGGPRSALDLHIGHRRHFTPEDLGQVLHDAGFAVEYSSGAGFPFFNLYRLMVIARGQQLVKEAAGKPSHLLRFFSALFRLLFKFNSDKSRLGWQVIAIAVNKDDRT